MDILKVGKLDSDILEKIVFGNIRYKSADVIKRAGLGEDCAVMDFGERQLYRRCPPARVPLRGPPALCAG